MISLLGPTPPTHVGGGCRFGAMKRSSDESKKQPSTPNKHSKLSEQQTSPKMTIAAVAGADTPSHEVEVRRLKQAADAASAGLEQGMQPFSFGSFSGVPHLSSAGYSNSPPSSSRGRGPGPTPFTIPGLLGNLPMHHHQYHHQSGQDFHLPLTFASQGAGSDSLAQYLLAVQLARDISGTGQHLSPQDQLSLLGITNSLQSQSNYIDRLIYNGRSTQQLAGQVDNFGGYNFNPRGPPMGGNSTAGDGGSNGAGAFSVSHTASSNPAATSDSISLALTTDRTNLSDYQCMIREQIDLFAATQADIDSSAQGRNRPIVVGQVGIRCRHCAPLPSSRRSRGAVYYPAKLSGLYQAAQNMTLNHFTTTCQSIPQPLKDEMLRLKKNKSYVLGGGKGYWARGGQIRNIIEIDDRLFFHDKVPERFRSDIKQAEGKN
uniref:Uncharacterized protein n=1 Tax=Amphora coffeiformis TaxID=265554 RepID=A0A7S3P7M9_9STRA|eukprot:scaffold4360_cov199-Amphora_coffeaeformis.AAC.5